MPFERHLFRQLQQQPDETVDQFVARLRQRAPNCDFTDVDEAVRDQLIDKYANLALRKKFLEKTGMVTLKMLQDTARAHEAVELQMRQMNVLSGSAQVNAVRCDGSRSRFKTFKKTDKKEERRKSCYRRAGWDTQRKMTPAQHGVRPVISVGKKTILKFVVNPALV